nr:polysaccharide deacetylase family protein [Gammaproteobacteria bacterium]
DDRVLILHIDDMGFCHAANAASLACLTEGSATCASILVNGPWFQEAVQMAKANPQLDLGVHLTLTAEYPTYRWPALSSRDPETGLLDADGYLWATREDAVRKVSVAAAEGEMRAQIDGALAAGIDVTHIDTHMGSVVHPKFLGSYLRLAHEYGVPAFLPRITRDRLQALGEGDMADEFLQVLAMIDTDQVPTLDDIIIETLVPKTSKHDFYRDLIKGVQPGLTHLLFHPAVAGAELEAIADTHASRHADYEAFLDRSLRDFAESLGIHLVGYRDLKAHLIA